MTIVQKLMAASGVAATFAVTVIAALPASAQSWHHHHVVRHRRPMGVGRPIVLPHHIIVLHRPEHHSGHHVGVRKVIHHR